MPKIFKIILVALLALGTIGAIIATTWYIGSHNIAVLNPKGTIAEQQRSLMMWATILMAVVVVPVLVLTFGIAWRYRASNTRARYSPSLNGSPLAETIWWLIPGVIIVILGVITWFSSHQLDPYRPIASNAEPLRVQVVALQWKWLFIYPDQHIATVNYLHIPEDRPIQFDITADAPMNSFWIPQLGGQVYAMAGMNTKLSLMADQPGDYQGQSANISGKGFAGMRFTAHASTKAEFDHWVVRTQQSKNRLTPEGYNVLAQPSENNPRAEYALPVIYDGFYDTIIMKYMTPNTEQGEH